MPEPLALVGAGWARVAALPALQPSPEAPRGLEPEDVSPGVEGFLATFAVVAVIVLLILSMVSRLRRLRHRADQERALQEQAAPRQADPGRDAVDDDAPGATSAVRPPPGAQDAEKPDTPGEPRLR